MSAPSPATHRLITTETGDPIVTEINRIFLQRLSGLTLPLGYIFYNLFLDEELQYVLLTQDVINGFNLAVVNSETEALTDSNAIVNKNFSEEGLKWTSQQILLFIRLVESNYSRFNEGLNKNVWLRIGNSLSTMTNKLFTAEQCDTKWKRLKRTYKVIKDYNNKTGNDRKKWEFFAAIDGFLSSKPEIEPLSVCSAATNELQIKSGNAPGVEASLPTTSASSEVTPRSTLSKKRKRSGGVEERHREKMKKCDKFLKLFKIAVEHQTGKTLSDDSD